MISRYHKQLKSLARTVLLGFGAGLVSAIIVMADELQPGHVRRNVTGEAFLIPRLQVRTGNEPVARQYYRNVVSLQMKFATPDTIETTSIKDLLAYFGYTGLSPKDLHQLSSEQLMALGADGELLATRFFAPKITLVSTPADATPKSGYGWRKLVRIRAKANSTAEANGIEFLYFLQNIFEKSTPSGDPFDAERNISLFNQAIATRKIGSRPYNDSKHGSYFFAYSPLVKCGANNTPVNCEPNNAPIKINGQFVDDGAIAFKLGATFDARKHPETGAAADNYFVPDSCVQCHGGGRTNGKTNYLDTDHWFDRVTPIYGLTDQKFSQEDFTGLARSPFGVVYDGGKDPTTDAFRKAFDIIRKLNEEIKVQNADVATDTAIGASSNFQLRAVTKWLDLHAAGAQDPVRHVPPHERGFGDPSWDTTNQQHRILLYYLNRYCYRCHSSIRYSIYERQVVTNKKADIADRVRELTDPTIWMPQDRIFPGLGQINGTATPTGDLKEFLDLLQQLQ